MFFIVSDEFLVWKGNGWRKCGGKYSYKVEQRRKTTDLSMKVLNTNNKEMINKFVLNTVLHCVGMSFIIRTNQQFEYDIKRNNPDSITDGHWYNRSVC